MTGFDALVPYEEALARIVAEAEALRDRHPTATREVGLWDASGYVLAEDVVADRDQPPFARSAMDGYAVRAADVTGSEARLKVVGEIAAGQMTELTLGPGEAIAIMTGAPVPAGADAVQMVEKTRRDGEDVIVNGPLTPGHNIAPQGEDAQRGQVVVEKGRVIESLTAGVLGSVGASHVTVFQRPRTTVMTTGDELVGVEDTPGPGQIRDSNRRTLMALLEREWSRVVDGGIVADDLGETRRAIREGLESDVLVLSGGVSAGVYDVVREALEEEGVEIIFHKVRIKPGKPLLFGRHAGGLVFGLPGNPVSTFVTGLMLLSPALRVLGHRPEHRTWYVRVPLVGKLPATGGRTSFHPAHITLGDDDRMSVRYHPWHGSADQFSFSRANALIRREPGEPAASDGEIVRVAIPHPLASW